jgi:hypothetical protein
MMMLNDAHHSGTVMETWGTWDRYATCPRHCVEVYEKTESLTITGPLGTVGNERQKEGKKWIEKNQKEEGSRQPRNERNEARKKEIRR